MYLLNLITIYIIIWLISYVVYDYVTYIFYNYNKHVEQEKEEQLELLQKRMEDVIEPLKTKLDEIYDYIYKDE